MLNKTKVYTIDSIPKKRKKLINKVREIQMRITKPPIYGSFFYNYLKQHNLNTHTGIAVSKEAIKAVLIQRPLNVYSNPTRLSDKELRRINKFNSGMQFPLSPEVIWRILEIEHELNREIEINKRPAARVYEIIADYHYGGYEHSESRVSVK